MTENNTVLLNIETTCRTCLKENSADELRSLIDNDLCNQISEVVNTQLSLSPSLPSGICSNCYKTINIAVNFKKQVHKSESYFRKLICKEESDNVTVICESFTMLTNATNSEDCYIGNVKEITSTKVTDKFDVKQNVKQEAIVETFLKEEDSYSVTDDESDESSNYIRSHKDGARDNINIQAELSAMANIIHWAEEENLKIDTSKDLENKIHQNGDTVSTSNVTCALCFSDSDEYLLHVKTDHPHYRPFVCPNCEERFFTDGGLSKHHSTHKQVTEKDSERMEDHENDIDDINSEHNEKEKTHIKKPLNAFMLYMKEMRAKAVAESMLKESAAINQMLGRQWHALGREKQAKYFELARREKQLHMELHPNWSCRAKATYRKRRREPASQDGGNKMKRCRARYDLDRRSKWCDPCRRKKKCIRYKELEGGDNSNDGNQSDDNLSTCTSLGDSNMLPDGEEDDNNDSPDLSISNSKAL